MTRKRVIFHIGAHKTGTTYLQSFFSQHIEELKSAGVDYPYSETNEVIEAGATVGNVVRLLYLEGLIKQKKNSFKMASLVKLWSEACSEKIVSVVEQSDSDTVLFSSEGMSVLPESTLQHLHQRLSAKYQVEFILFVRDPYDFFYSAWRQVLKSGLATDDFHQFASKQTDKAQSSKRKMGMFNGAKVLIDNNIKHTIINYDTYKKNLSDAFLKAANIDLSIPPSKNKPSRAIHNRSLSPSEAQLQSIANKQFRNTQLPAFLRTKLLRRENYKPVIKNFYDKEIDQLVLNSYGSVINDINKSIWGDKLRTEVRNDDKSQPMIEAQDVTVFIDTFKFIESVRSRKVSVLHKAKHFIKASLLKNVPFDFDPQAYLDMNNDVAISNIDPYIHYSRNGYLEGRPYKYY